MDNIVDHLRDDRKRHLLRYWWPLNMVKKVFAEVGNNPSLSDYRWSIYDRMDEQCIAGNIFFEVVDGICRYRCSGNAFAAPNVG